MSTSEAREAYSVAYEAWIKARQDGAPVAIVTKLYGEAKKAQTVLKSLLKGEGQK